MNESSFVISVMVQAFGSKDVSDFGYDIRRNFIDNLTGFFTLKQLRPLNIGPLIKSENANAGDKLLQQTFNFVSEFNYEIN